MTFNIVKDKITTIKEIKESNIGYFSKVEKITSRNISLKEEW